MFLSRKHIDVVAAHPLGNFLRRNVSLDTAVFNLKVKYILIIKETYLRGNI